MSKTYNSTRSILSILEVVGWLVAVVGFIMIGAALLNQKSGAYDYSGFDTATAWSVGVLGVVELVSGLMLVALNRVGYAILDIAEASGNPGVDVRTSGPEDDTSQDAGASNGQDAADVEGHVGTVQTLQGEPIVRLRSGKFLALQVEFETLGEAKAFVLTSRAKY